MKVLLSLLSLFSLTTPANTGPTPGVVMKEANSKEELIGKIFRNEMISKEPLITPIIPRLININNSKSRRVI